jgi:hypothetical protein
MSPEITVRKLCRGEFGGEFDCTRSCHVLSSAATASHILSGRFRETFGRPMRANGRAEFMMPDSEERND